MADMTNPFQIIESRLCSIETILETIRNQNDQSFLQKDDLDDIGPISLAEKITGLAKPTIYTLVAQRKIPSMKKGKKLYFSKKDLIEWIKSGRKNTEEETSIDGLKLLLKRKNRKKGK